MEVDVSYVFDEILGRHMERLLGSRSGIGGLQLRVGSIACLVLLADHPAGPQEGQPAPPANTLELLKEKLAELGLRDKEKAESLIRDMIEKGYILVDDQGKVTGGKPASSMSQLLDRLFPRLNGKTLVAYFIQTIDEVLSGRKTMEAAVAQFDQALKMQGVPIKTHEPEKSEQSPKPPPQKKETSGQIQREMQKVLRRSREPSTEEGAGFRIIGSEGSSFKLKDIRTVPMDLPPAPGKGALEEKEPETPIEESTEGVSAPVGSPEESSVEISQQEPPDAQEEPPVLQTQPQELQPQKPQPQPEELQPQHQPPEPVSEGISSEVEQPPETISAVAEQRPELTSIEGLPSEEAEPPQMAEHELPEDLTPEPEKAEEPEELRDDLIEKEISSFQEDLAALCPLCKEGKVREQKTATGKPYYKCDNRACSLVSWGKPHHIACPNCNNPFLIEVSSNEEEVRLRCPRATCNYRCTVSPDSDIPGRGAGSQDKKKTRPRRRVVRRRVVRKKK